MIQRRAFLMASVAVFTVQERLLAEPTAIATGSQTVHASGVRAPIEIIEDALGIPHVRATSRHVADFGQGYLVAPDRLFQIDMEYRRDLGRMAEVFGPRFVAADDPRSPHCNDFYDRWIAGDMQPLWFSRQAVDAHAANQILLTPT